MLTPACHLVLCSDQGSFTQVSRGLNLMPHTCQIHIERVSILLAGTYITSLGKKGVGASTHAWPRLGMGWMGRVSSHTLDQCQSQTQDSVTPLRPAPTYTLGCELLCCDCLPPPSPPLHQQNAILSPTFPILLHGRL